MNDVSVPHSLDFERIATLPRRLINKADAARWAQVFTAEFRAPGGTRALKPWQGQALYEALENRGGLFALPVGIGKTDISYLLALLFEAERCVLIMSAAGGLHSKTEADFQAYRGQWQAPRHPHILVGREMLARDGNQDLLRQLRPDLIIIEEADDFCNQQSAAVRRVDRFIVDNPNVPVILLTGTPQRNSILDTWHMLCWALKDRAPVPMRLGEARLWAAVLDRKPRNPRRPDPGPLGHDRASALAWYQRRYAETPGILAVDEDSCDAKLHVRTRCIRECPKLDAVFQRLNLDNEDPGGNPITVPLVRWGLDGHLGLGLYHYYDPPPPDEFVLARRAMAKFVREQIARSHLRVKPTDTEAQVLRHFKDAPEVQAWLAVKHLKPKRSKTAWVSDAALDTAVAWLAESDTPSVIWCGSVDFAVALAKRTGLPYYGAHGTSSTGRGLHEAEKGRSLIASWNANKKGFNLQAWPRQSLFLPPQSAKWLEQVIGRAHRQGQTRTVDVTIFLGSGLTADMLDAALGEAKFVKATTTLTQKLLRARISRDRPHVTSDNKYRWARSSNKEGQAQWD